MIKHLLTAAIVFIYFNSYSQPVSMPTGYKILDEAEGDLNKDGAPEKVIVFDTNDSTESGTIRDIQIFKRSGSKWTLWVSSKNAVGKSQDGGMMGDPFRDIEIKNGVLLINQDGGSSWKWAHTDKYRFQNGEFQLIGYSSFYGRLCDYWESFDFNILTGKIQYSKEYESCEEQEQKITKVEKEAFYKKGIKLNILNRYLKEVKIVTPKYKQEIYL